jgi:hypothetical protein
MAQMLFLTMFYIVLPQNGRGFRAILEDQDLLIEGYEVVLFD